MQFLESFVKTCWTGDQEFSLNNVKEASGPFDKQASIDGSNSPSAIDEVFKTDFISNAHAFTFSELKTITKNFRLDLLLGMGGFGKVYKGFIDEEMKIGIKAQPVAVKVLDLEGHQGHKEWLAEVTILGQLSHSHLVQLIGYCCEGKHRMLVYEFMAKGCLDRHLFRKMCIPLSWSRRLQILLGAAKGLSFLHSAEKPIIYCDLKTSNILLDKDYTAKLSDFGLAKCGSKLDKTYMSTVKMGTHGYADPHYIMTGHLTVKSDVYSFGVVLLEMLTGRRAIDEMRPAEGYNLIEWARPFLKNKRKLSQILDPRMEKEYTIKEAQKVANLAYQCLRQNPKSRPTMKNVVEILEYLQIKNDLTNISFIYTTNSGFIMYKTHSELD